MRSNYEDFKNLPVAKMAQKISDMTFCYEDTKVPAKHYKQMLSKSYEELIEDSVALNLLNLYYKTIKQLAGESPKWFMQALICLELNINPANISSENYQALELTRSKFSEQKHINITNRDIIELFKQIKEHGAGALLDDI